MKIWPAGGRVVPCGRADRETDRQRERYRARQEDRQTWRS